MSCFDCHFYSKDGCAVNPNYRKAWEALQHSSDDFKRMFRPLLVECPSRKAPKKPTFQFTLSEKEWRYRVERDRLLNKYRQQIAQSLGIQVNSCKDDSLNKIPF